MDEFSLSPEQIEGILCFQGYGVPSAPVWFVGIEEGLGKMSEDDAKHNLRARGSFASVMDLRDAHLRLVERGRPIDIERKDSFTQVWQYMAKVMLARNGTSNWRDSQAVKQYVRFQLGRCDKSLGETFLTELSPIPTNHSKNKEWYQWFQSNVGVGLERKLENRRQGLKRLLAEHGSNRIVPRLVVCYSQPRAHEFAQLLDIEWKTDPQCPQVSSAFRDATRYLLLPFFGNGQMGHDIITYLISAGHLLGNP